MKKKLIGFGIFCLIIGVLFLFDFFRSRLYTIDLVDVSPNPVPADGNTLVTLKVRLTRGKKPVQNHDLYTVSLDGGVFVVYRSRTNSGGEAVFEYYPYQVSGTYALRDIRFRIRDESNSVFFEIGAENTFIVKAIAGETKAASEGGLKLSDIFGE